MPCHPLPIKTAIKNCFWHHSIALSLFLPTPHRHGAVEISLCEICVGKRGISTHYWQLSFPRATQKPKGICPHTHVQDTINLCTGSQSNFSAKHKDTLTALHHHSVSWGNRGRGVQSLDTSVDLPNRLLACLNHRYRDHQNGRLGPCMTKLHLHCRTPCLLDRVKTTQGPVGLDIAMECI